MARPPPGGTNGGSGNGISNYRGGHVDDVVSVWRLGHRRSHPKRGAGPGAPASQFLRHNFLWRDEFRWHGILNVFPARTLTTLYRCRLLGMRDRRRPANFPTRGWFRALMVISTERPFDGGGIPNGNNGTVFQITAGGHVNDAVSIWRRDRRQYLNPIAALIQGADGDFLWDDHRWRGQLPAAAAHCLRSRQPGTLTTLYQFGGVPQRRSQPPSGSGAGQ